MPDRILAIDLGTTTTAGALSTGGTVEIVEVQGSSWIPSAVLWERGDGARPGRVLIGREAEARADSDPTCLESDPKARLAAEGVELGGRRARPVELVAMLLGAFVERAKLMSGGEAPTEVRLTHPGHWDEARVEALREAGTLAGVAYPVLIPEPVAAAEALPRALAEGERAAILNLGGGPFEAAVVRRAGGRLEIVGRARCDESVRGDAAVVDAEGGLDGVTLKAAFRAVAEATLAAGAAPEELQGIHLTGGLNRVPGVSDVLAEHLGARPVPVDEPETATAVGAARLELALGEGDGEPLVPLPLPEAEEIFSAFGFPAFPGVAEVDRIFADGSGDGKRVSIEQRWLAHADPPGRIIEFYESVLGEPDEIDGGVPVWRSSLGGEATKLSLAITTPGATRRTAPAGGRSIVELTRISSAPMASSPPAAKPRGRWFGRR